MQKVYVVMGEHFNVPGLRVSAHTTRLGAVGRAAELVNLMIKDTGWKQLCDVSTWEASLERLQDHHGAQYCDVSVVELDVES